jgi:hypothetical protein
MYGIYLPHLYPGHPRATRLFPEVVSLPLGHVERRAIGCSSNELLPALPGTISWAQILPVRAAGERHQHVATSLGETIDRLCVLVFFACLY